MGSYDEILDQVPVDELASRLGGSSDEVVNQLGGLGGTSGGLVQKLLPLLAPIVMSWLANKMGQGGLGGMLGGGAGSASSDAAGAGAGAGSTDGPLFPGGAGATSGPVQAPGSATSTGAAAG